MDNFNSDNSSFIGSGGILMISSEEFIDTSVDEIGVSLGGSEGFTAGLVCSISIASSACSGGSIIEFSII